MKRFENYEVNMNVLNLSGIFDHIEDIGDDDDNSLQNIE
jgi:hypothetical protein